MIREFNLKILENIGVEVVPAEELEEILSEAQKSQKPLIVKLGMDPTSPDLHLGHYVVLKIAREFLEAGHKINIIIGDFTAKIGDPSGRNVTRPILSDKEIKANVKTYLNQLSKALDVKKIKVFYNSDWFSKMKFEDVLKLSGMFSLNRILEREDFKKRLGDQLEVRAHEIFYSMMQAYDSTVLESNVELGGVDQKLNILAGRQLQQAMGQRQQVAILTPILVGTEGQKKMSKSLGNYIGLGEAPSDIYGKVMSLKDDLMPNYFRLVLGYSENEILEINAQIRAGENPMNFKKRLAYEIVKVLYSEKEAEAAGGKFTKVFSQKEIPEEMSEAAFGESSAPLFEILRSGIPQEEMTSSEIKRLIMQGSIRVEGKVFYDPYQKIKLSPQGVVIKIGKRKWLKAIGK
ncbi:MAG: tyrosine--tRNA ligase [Patescibacteria group bacterium]